MTPYVYGGLKVILFSAALVWGFPTNALGANDWELTTRLTAPDAAVQDRFGISVAIDGAYTVAGAYAANVVGTDSGAAYVFNSYTGGYVSKLLPTDGDAEQSFGWEVGVSGGKVIVGAPYINDIRSEYGAAYVFDAATGNQLRKITPDDLARGDRFGSAVALSGDLAVVGSPTRANSRGKAYVFDSDTGQQLAALEASDGAGGDWFGVDVAIDGSSIAVGAFRDQDNGEDAGSVYVFNLDGTLRHKLLAPDGQANDWFGRSVGVFEGKVVVGAPRSNSSVGKAYVFDADTGQHLLTLAAPDGGVFDEFGFSVDVDGGLVAVGSFGHVNPSGSIGKSYLFNVNTGALVAELFDDGTDATSLGHHIEIDDGVVVAGSWSDANQRGAAYLFTPEPVSAAFVFLGMLGAIYWRQH